MEYRGKKINFIELLNNNVVQIPIIQRDYAQGRADKYKLRENFLEVLKETIINSRQINLDFIYGSEINDKLQPLDGQQRLTTLFLLHWYAACKSNKLEEVEAILSKFTYETRSSSREFCTLLVEESIDTFTEYEKISSKIKNSIWYFLSWDQDPTVSAMLRSLDHIHEKFFNVNNLYEKLYNEDAIITFYYIELENFGLSDDLYIKMNARGKQLTAFESFKAQFEKFLKQKNWDLGKNFADIFSYKVDTKWTDLFWEQCTKQSVDGPMLMFFTTIAMIHLAIDKPDLRQEDIRELQSSYKQLLPEYFSENAYGYLHKALDEYSKILASTVDLNIDFPFEQYLDDGRVFKTMYSNEINISYTKKVIVFAHIEYLINSSNFEYDKYLRWMRLIRNIVYRGDYNRKASKAAIVRSPETFEGAINLINELSDGCQDINDYLVNSEVKSKFAKSQIEEEILKSKLISKNENWREAIYLAEDMDFTSGNIKIIFDCMKFSGKSSKYELKLFKEITNVFKKYFENGVNDKLRRALLTISDENNNYEFYNYWWSWSNLVEADKRCLIAKDREFKYFVFGNYKDNEYYRQYFIKLVDKLLKNSLESIISDFVIPSSMPDWQGKLIKEPDLLEKYCDSKYIAISDDKKTCYLLKGIRPRKLESVKKVE